MPHWQLRRQAHRRLPEQHHPRRAQPGLQGFAHLGRICYPASPSSTTRAVRSPACKASRTWAASATATLPRPRLRPRLS
jgi:hypothetical protein